MIGRISHRSARAGLVTLILLFAVAAVFRSTGDEAQARDEGPGAPAGTSERTPSVFFEENRGQFDPQVRYQARGTDGHTLFLTDKEAAYVVIGGAPEARGNSSENEKARGAAVFLRFEGASSDARSSGRQELGHRTNHFAGNDPEKWVTEVPNYAAVNTADLYSGVDLKWSASEHGRAGITFTAEKESDLDNVSILIEGAEEAELTDDGGLLVKTAAGPISIPAPKISLGREQALHAADASFVLRGSSESESLKGPVFRIGIGKPGASRETRAVSPIRADRSSLAGSLTNLAYSTFLGGSLAEVRQQQDVAVDHLGQAYVVGNTVSSDFPSTPGTFDPTNDPNGHAISVTKFNAAGSGLVYSTFIQGTATVVHAIAIDTTGNAYITGFTGFTSVPSQLNYPTTTGAFDTTHNGGPSDAFVTKLNPSGSALEFSTFIGSSTDDWAFAIDIDSAGNSYITGFTGDPSSFPIVPGSFQTFAHGLTACFVTRLNAAGDDLDWSGFLGGSGGCQSKGIAVDTTGAAYVTGFTYTNTTVPFPTTTGAFDESENGHEDAFAVKIDASGTAIEYSTMLGGGRDDRGWDVKVSPSGNAYVVGWSEWSPTAFPSTPGVFQETQLGLNAFVVRLSADGSAMDFGTFFGSDLAAVNAFDLALAADGSIYIGGQTDGTGLPVTANAYDQSHNGAYDAFIAEFSADATSLEYSTYIGGNDWDSGWGLDIDPDENVYLFGYTENGTINYPTTPGAFDTTINSTQVTIGDYMLTKFGKGVVTSVYVPFDFDGDGVSDIGIFRPIAGPLSESPETGPGAQWWLLHSQDLSTRGVAFGISSDIPAPADFTGDGIEDIAFFRPGIGDWYVLRSDDSTFFAFPFGVSGDIPAPGDFDGDGIADPTVYRPQHGVWYSFLSGSSQTIAVPFGVNGDRPLIGDYDGDGQDDIAIYRPSANQWWQFRSSGGVKAYAFGAPGDIPTVPVDFTGDGTDDVIFYRPSDGNWFVLRSDDDTYFAFPWGVAGDLPVPGYFDDDNIADAAVFRPSDGTWYIFGSNSGFRAVQFGISTDVPLPYVYAAP